MALFRRSGKPRLGAKDAAVLDALRSHGADLTKPRDTVAYLYFRSRADAEAAAGEAAGDGWEIDVREPLPQYPDDWPLVCRRDAATTAELVAAMSSRFAALAAAHGGRYDGWEAAL
jgi:regulator of RNase E activity RraB